ncbi:MAG TPA: S-layer homology domain-containing protein [Thermoanaerobaculia bacterium]|nr:S-layer homology domain-containing protein [Thermoanaerobaculia bacterium]
MRSSHGPAYLPPLATGTLFQDVPAGHWAGRWIEQLAADGVAAGCGGGSYCPDAPLTRAEIARLLLQARHGSGFTPPPRPGRSSTTSRRMTPPRPGSKGSRPRAPPSAAAATARRGSSPARRWPSFSYGCSACHSPDPRAALR